MVELVWCDFDLKLVLLAACKLLECCSDELSDKLVSFVCMIIVLLLFLGEISELPEELNK